MQRFSVKAAGRRVRQILDAQTGTDAPSLSDLRRAYRYISFDIFDTLIVRDVCSPSDVFRVMGLRLHQPDFCERRVLAEQTARAQSSSHEVTLTDIYRCFAGIPAETARQYLRLELDTEQMLCHPDRRMMRFYHQCRERYPVVLVSDMYLTAPMLQRLLAQCGITGYRHLYVSCDAGCTKRSGALYDTVCDDLGISAGDMLHVGNDFLADALAARRKGLDVLKIKPGRILLSGCAAAPEPDLPLSLQVLYRLIGHTAPEPGSPCDAQYRFGYEVLGMLLTGFCLWLMQQMQADGAEEIRLSRESAPFLQPVYEAMGCAEIVPVSQQAHTAALAGIGMHDTADTASRRYCILADGGDPSLRSYGVPAYAQEPDCLAQIFRRASAEAARGAAELARTAHAVFHGRRTQIRSEYALYFLRRFAEQSGAGNRKRRDCL